MVDQFEFVRVRECPDGSHPEGDGVFIHPKPTLECGLAARQDMFVVFNDPQYATDEDKDRALLRRWFDTYCRLAPVSWTLHDADGAVWAFDPARLVDDFDLGYPVADRADDLYKGVVMRPLLETAPPTSRNGAAARRSTPARTTSTRSRRSSSSRNGSGGQPSQAPTP